MATGSNATFVYTLLTLTIKLKMKGRLIGFGNPQIAKKQPEKKPIKTPIKKRHKCNGFVVVKTTNNNTVIKGNTCSCIGVVKEDGTYLTKKKIADIFKAFYPFTKKCMKKTQLEGDDIVEAMKTLAKATLPC